MKSLLLACLSAGCTQAACYTPSDGTPGWKAVVIPAVAPALSAPEGVDQVRGGEPAVVWTDEITPVDAWSEHGHRELFFEVRSDQRALEVHFAAPLDGARVGAPPHAPNRRVRGDRVLFTWLRPVDHLTVEVHQHFRSTPIVRQARAGSPAVVAGTRPGVLYYKQPPGRRVLLCDAPERTLAVAPDAELSQAQPIALHRSYVRLPSGPVQ